MQTEELELIRRIIHGETDLYAQLVDRHERTVFTLVMRIIGRREEAEEITQDVFLKAFRQLDRFAGRSSFRTWLYRIACNAAISQARRTQPRRAEIDERRLAVLPDEEADRMEEWAAHQEQLDALTHAIGRLDPEERALVTLFYYEERSVAECAEITALSESNVKVRLHRIRKKLYLLVTTQREMKRSEAIRRAIERIPIPEPPADLSARIMKRLRRAERCRRRIEAILTGTGFAAGIAGIAGIAAVARWTLTAERTATESPAWPDPVGWKMPDLELSLPTPAPEDAMYWKACILLAAAGLVLLFADLIIRRRIASLRK